jgi:hypothetical protein
MQLNGEPGGNPEWEVEESGPDNSIRTLKIILLP